MTVRTSIPWLDDMGSVLDSAAEEVALRAQALMDPFVPKETGALRGSARVDGSGVVYTEDYADAVYGAPEDAGWTTPGTGPRWDEKMVDERGEELAEYAALAVLEGML